MIERTAVQPNVESLARDTMERIDAPLGAAFVVPVDPALLTDAGKPLRLLLDDGLELPGSLYRVSLAPVARARGNPWEGWLGPRYSWHAAPISHADAVALAATDTTVGFALLVDPKEGRSDNAVWLGADRVPMQWLASMETLTLANPSLQDGPWTPTLPDAARGQRPVHEALLRECTDPLRRWRAMLALDGLRPGVSRTLHEFEHPLLEALARQQEHRWRVALARLWAQDAALCERIKQRLAAVAMVAPGVYAPVWEADQAALDRLLLDLLSAHLPSARRAQLAEQWLAERPRAAAWVVDEGGSFLGDDPESRLPGAVVTMVNLLPEPATSWAGLDGERAPAEMRVAPPLECVVELREIPAAAGASHVVRAHVGEWTRSLPVLPMPVPAAPPGVSTGLFASDVDMLGLLSGDIGRGGDPDWETAALLHRPARGEGVMPEHRRWELYVECRVPEGTDRGAESLLVVTGPFGAPSASWRVGHDGSITSLRPQDAAVLEELGSEVARATVVDLPDRWIARVPLPPGSIEADGLLRLGVSREDARGVRSAWPRAMAPWQVEPARACVDVSAWSE
ncbi:MAG TPA: hypothetical protein VHN77_00300 [Phycisphaerales bacterium]|nr:hypothetical protein [Phycisphaerales bacterium]